MKVIHEGGTKGKVSVCAVRRGKNRPRSYQTTSKQDQNGTSSQSKQPLVCFGCRKLGHRVPFLFWVSSECLAKHATYSLCHQVSHFKAFSQPKCSVLRSRKGGDQQGTSISNKCLHFHTHSTTYWVYSRGQVHRHTVYPVPFLAQSSWVIEISVESSSSKLRFYGCHPAQLSPIQFLTLHSWQ